MDLSLACEHPHNELECFRGIETLDPLLEQAPLNEITIYYVT